MHKNIIKASLFTPGNAGRWGLTLLFWGPPGGGKTSVYEEVAGEFSMPCETFALSERGEGAVGAVPVPKLVQNNAEDYSVLAKFCETYMTNLKTTKGDTEEAIRLAMKEFKRNPTLDAAAEMVLSYPRPDWTDKFAKSGRGVIIVDEIVSCPPAVMPALMGLQLAGRIGSYTLPPGVRRAALANPVEQAAMGYELPMPLANRMGHLDWQMPSVEEHTQYMLRGASGTGKTELLLGEMEEDAGGEVTDRVNETFDAAGEEARVMKVWPEAWARAVGLETAFLNAKSSMKNMMPKPGTPAAGRAWPSDRTWEMATRAYASAIVHALSESETELFVEAFIGAGAAGEWFEFIAAQDLPNAAKLLDGKETFNHDSTRVDRTIAVLQSCVALVSPKTAVRRTERTNTLWQVLESMTDRKADLDLLVPSVQALIESDLASLKYAAKVLAKINPTLKAAGIKPRGSR